MYWEFIPKINKSQLLLDQKQNRYELFRFFQIWTQMSASLVRVSKLYLSLNGAQEENKDQGLFIFVSMNYQAALSVLSRQRNCESQSSLNYFQEKVRMVFHCFMQ